MQLKELRPIRSAERYAIAATPSPETQSLPYSLFSPLIVRLLGRCLLFAIEGFSVLPLFLAFRSFQQFLRGICGSLRLPPGLMRPKE